MNNQILLVEDNPDDIKLTIRAFNKYEKLNGYNIHIAKDGKEAIDYLKKEENDNPYFILLDLNLPVIDGFEVIKFIRNHESTKLIPVIILTSSTEKKDLKRIYDLGANSYIQKPVDYNIFIDVIKKISSYWLHLNENPS